MKNKGAVYRDRDGWLYQIRHGKSGYRIWYKKPRAAWLSYFLFPWRDRFDEAQLDLDDHAKEEGWEVLSDESHTGAI